MTIDVKALNQMFTSADKMNDLMHRSFAVYPIRQNILELKKRHETGDKNVMAYRDEHGAIDHYELKFTAEQSQELRRAYKDALGDRVPTAGQCEKVFVRILEAWGAAIPELMSVSPLPNKSRQRAIVSFANSMEKMDAALDELDGGGLGWLYANVVDKLSENGVRVSPDDMDIVSMKNHPIKAMVEAGEFRQELRKLTKAVVDAAVDAKENLPIIDRVENDPRFTTAKALERRIIEEGFEFSTSEVGFPAQCLRAIFELGGLDVEKVSYWLKKVAEDPDSYAKFRQRMQEKTEGKNPP